MENTQGSGRCTKRWAQGTERGRVSSEVRGRQANLTLKTEGAQFLFSLNSVIGFFFCGGKLLGFSPDCGIHRAIGLDDRDGREQVRYNDYIIPNDAALEFKRAEETRP